MTFLPEQRQLREGHDVSFGLTAASLGPCYRVFDGSIVRLSACASLLVGALHAVVFDPARGRTSQLLWLAATAGLRADWSPILRWKLYVGVDGVAPLQHRDYLVEQAPAEYGTVFTDPWVSGIFYLGMGVQY